MANSPFAMLLSLLAWVLLILPATSAKGEIAVARIFSDHMILQRDLPVPIWGKATAGAMVTVQFDDQSVHAKSEADGRWRIALRPMKASEDGRELVVQSGDQRVVIKDVLVGEVWFAGGQSNMAYTTGEMARRLPQGKTMVETAKLPGLRFRRIHDRDSPVPKDDLAGGSWDVCTPEAIANHSAVALVFARRLHEELKVPVGIIDCSWGGTPIEPYIPASAFTGHPTLEKLAAYAKAGDIEAIKKMTGGTYVRSPAWLAGAIYNGRIAPVAPYAIRGTLWYQGESNCGTGEDPRDYAHKMRALIQGWRDAWGRPQLPCYFVQLPQWNSYAWTYLREEQRQAMDVKHTGMVVTIDLDNAGDIHPPNKIDVGERLALWPLEKVYSKEFSPGRETVISGPLYREVSVRESSIIVKFDHIGGGLMTARSTAVEQVIGDPDTALGGFELTGSDGVWHEAEAKIEGETVVVSSRQVKRPLAVRYACHPKVPSGTMWNLYNAAGLPASPFCSDWSKMPYDLAKNPMPK